MTMIRIENVTPNRIGELQSIGRQTFYETFSAGNTKENLMQARLLVRYEISGKAWFWTSFVGMSIVYILYDVLGAKINMGPEEVLPLVTAVGSLLAGVLQYHYVLKPTSRKSGSWIIFNCLGWTVAHVLLNVVFLLNFHKQPGLPVFLVVIFALTSILGGGPILGFITGRSMVSALTRNPD